MAITPPAGLTTTLINPVSTVVSGVATQQWTVPNRNITGPANIQGNDADILIGGKSMTKWMEKVEQRLCILEPKPMLLAKYAALQQAFDHYKTLEALLHGSEDAT